MPDTISPEQQRLIIEKLHRSTDSLASTEKHNATYGHNLGERTMEINEFARAMKGTDYLSRDVESFTKAVTGHSIDLETL